MLTVLISLGIGFGAGLIVGSGKVGSIIAWVKAKIAEYRSKPSQ